jgi:hypothetical protein
MKMTALKGTGSMLDLEQPRTQSDNDFMNV